MAIKYIDNRLNTGLNDGSSPENAFQSLSRIQTHGIFSAGTIFVFAAGSGPYREVLPFVIDGTEAQPITWDLNGCTVTAMNSLNDPILYKWNLSTTGTNEWYLTSVGGGNPSLSPVGSCSINGVAQIRSAIDPLHKRGMLGSLTNLQYGWGDNDTLGFSTFYMRSDGGSPNTTGLSVEASQRTGVVSNGLNHHIVMDGFLFGGGNADAEAGSSVVWYGTEKITFRRIVFGYANMSAVFINGTGTAIVENCIGFWPGHRFVNLAGNGTLNVYNSIDIGGHLFALVDAAVATGTLRIRNCIGYGEESGAIDKKSATAILDEDYNCWYPSFVDSASGKLGYVNTVNWTTTGANDIPASHPTTENSRVNLFDPAFKLVAETFSGSDFRLQSSSPCVGSGAVIYGWSVDKLPDIGALEYFPTPPGALTAESELLPPAIAAQQEVPYGA
jgi:hypothetical protein